MAIDVKRDIFTEIEMGEMEEGKVHMRFLYLSGAS